MKTLKSQFKLIVLFLIFLNFFNYLLAKNIDKFSNSKDLSKYFSGIVANNNNQYQVSYNYLKSLKSLEDSHYSYSQYLLYSQISLEKFKDAANYSRELERKKLDNFETNLVAGIYYLKNEDLKQSRFYFEKLKRQSPPDTIQSLLSVSLNNWVNFSNIGSALTSLKSMPKRFENIRNIQEVFMYCYFNSNQTDNAFKKLTQNSKINYSRYYFFYADYLISNGDEKKAKEVLKTALNLYPTNLILNQLQTDINQKQKISNKFDCKKINHSVAEILYVVSNGLSTQKNYAASSFYLKLAKFLNPNFTPYDLLYAENFEVAKEYSDAKKTYEKIKRIGADYNWHASKRIASILKRQKKEGEAIDYLKISFLKIKNPKIYEIFDYAEFLKNNEKFEDSIKYYTKLIELIDKDHNLYARAFDGRGIAHERTKQWNKAEADLLESLRVSPEEAYVINYLAYSWIEKGINIEKSLKMLKKANQLRPNDGYITDSLGWALFKLKKYKEAKKYMQLAVRLMASDPVINDHFADVLWINNDFIQARYYWSYVLKLEKTEEKLKKEIENKLLFGIKS